MKRVAVIFVLAMVLVLAITVPALAAKPFSSSEQAINTYWGVSHDQPGQNHMPNYVWVYRYVDSMTATQTYVAGTIFTDEGVVQFGDDWDTYGLIPNKDFVMNGTSLSKASAVVEASLSSAYGVDAAGNIGTVTFQWKGVGDISGTKTSGDWTLTREADLLVTYDFPVSGQHWTESVPVASQTQDYYSSYMLTSSKRTLASPPPIANGAFTGADEAGAEWRVVFEAKGALDPTTGLPAAGIPGTGRVMLTSSEVLPDGTPVVKSFTVDVELYFSIDRFGQFELGAIAALCGHVVASSGDGVPAVGEFCYFVVFDGQGDLASDGTPLPDRWKYWTGTGSPSEMRSFQRTILWAMGQQGANLWPVIDGNIQVKRGAVE